jgi:hypothetical protein
MRAAASSLSAALVLLALTSAIVVLGAIVEVIGRPTGPETVARRYFAALELSDVQGALDEIEPDARPRWAPFVENGVANQYRVVGIAVRSASLLDRLGGAPPEPTDVTIFLDITQAVDGARWQATPRVPLVRLQGRWYLAHPPLAPI